jgi:MoxR-like ATPase
MDRWNIVVTLNYLPAETEARIVLAKSASTIMSAAARRSSG